jgi:hypothetical protein
MHAPRTIAGRIALVAACLTFWNAVLFAQQQDAATVASLSEPMTMFAEPADPAPLGTAVAEAAPAFVPPPSPWRARGLHAGLFGTFVALQALDTATTLHAVRSQGGRELNPFMSGLTEHPAAFVATKSAFTAATILLVRHAAKQHPKAAVWTAIVMNSAYGCIVANNFHQMGR